MVTSHLTEVYRQLREREAEERTAAVAAAHAQHGTELRRLQAEAEGRIAALQDKLSAAEQALGEQRQSEPAVLRKLQDLLGATEAKRRSAAKVKGAEGEQTLTTLLRDAFSMADGFKTSNVAQAGKEADVRVQMLGLVSLWDAKNWDSRNVTLRDVEKMRADVERNSDVDLGVLVSLRSGVSGFDDQPIAMEVLPCGKPVVYVNRLLADGYAEGVRLLRLLRPLLDYLSHAKATRAADLGSPTVLRLVLAAITSRADAHAQARKKVVQLIERLLLDVNSQLLGLEADLNASAERFKAQFRL